MMHTERLLKKNSKPRRSLSTTRSHLVQPPEEIWEALQTAHEGIMQVKNSKINMLTTKYELVKMKEDESIHDMQTRFTSIINELNSLGEVITTIKLVRKFLGVLPNLGTAR